MYMLSHLLEMLQQVGGTISMQLRAYIQLAVFKKHMADGMQARVTVHHTLMCAILQPSLPSHPPSLIHCLRNSAAAGAADSASQGARQRPVVLPRWQPGTG